MCGKFGIISSFENRLIFNFWIFENICIVKGKSISLNLIGFVKIKNNRNRIMLLSKKKKRRRRKMKVMIPCISLTMIKQEFELENTRRTYKIF